MEKGDRKGSLQSPSRCPFGEPFFLASEFIYKNELPPLLRAAQKEGLQVLWIHISDSSYTETPIAKYQAVGDPAKPLSLMSEGQQDRVCVKLCTELKNDYVGPFN